MPTEAVPEVQLADDYPYKNEFNYKWEDNQWKKEKQTIKNWNIIIADLIDTNFWVNSATDDNV